MTLVRFLDTAPQVISAETTLNARPEEVYALVADPARHAELDGGTTIRGLLSGSTGLMKVGDTFAQKMVLGIPYTLPMKVIRAEENRAVTWRHPGKHTWGFEILDNNDGTVTVRETFDASDSPLSSFYHLVGSFKANHKNIALTLANLHRIFA